MKVAIFYNQEERSILAKEKLQELLTKEKIIIDEQNPEVILSIGGDGTMLKAFHKYETMLEKVQFVGIHTGHLGFYTDWRDFELTKLAKALKENKAASVSYPLLEVILQSKQKKEQHFLALNESTIRRVSKTLVGEVYIKDYFLENFRGDGLSVATPTGSTAYNKSIGGAVISPKINVLQLTEIASLNNFIFRTLGSPIVVAPDEFIKINLTQNDTTNDYILTIDQENISTKDICSLIFQIAKARVHFLSFRHLHFWERVRESFIGGMQNAN